MLTPAFADAVTRRHALRGATAHRFGHQRLSLLLSTALRAAPMTAQEPE